MTKPTQLDVREHREPDYAIESIFYERWSPRAMAGAPVDDDQLFRLFEAARWAPSSFNRQPWRFLYAKRDGPHWTTFLNLLSESNRRWADQAAVLVVIASLQQTEDGKHGTRRARNGRLRLRESPLSPERARRFRDRSHGRDRSARQDQRSTGEVPRA
jgi:nitroreductase